MGMKSRTARSTHDFQRSIKKAISNNHHAISFPCNALHPSAAPLKSMIKTIEQHSLKSSFSIHAEYLDIEYEKWRSLIDKRSDLTFILHNTRNISWEKVRSLISEAQSFEILLIVTKENAKEKTFSHIPTSFHPYIRFYAPIKLSPSDLFLKTKKLFHFLSRVKKSFNSISILPSEKIDLFEPRVPLDMELMPIYKPYSINDNNEHKKFSIIIPSYNHKNYLMRTLDHLVRQKYPPTSFEIIIIDDGSSDDTEKEVKKFIHQNKTYGFKYIKFPRFSPRTMGDGRFRAGLSRNLGLQNSCGENIFFLDSDVLLPPTALRTLEDDLQSADLVQIKRYDLTEEFTLSKKEIECINHNKDIISHGRSYWHDFFDRGDKWDLWPNKWKYVCTYGLAMKKDLLDQIGWIRKTYTFYGFEDTEIGYQVAKKKGKYKLSSITSYHQYHGKDRSEFFNRQRKRQKVLSRTAKIFYHNNLSSDIFNELKVYMGPDYSWTKSLIHFLKSIIS